MNIFSYCIFLLIVLESSATLLNRSWFWSVLAISLALFGMVISVLVILSCIQYMKHKANNQSDVSSDRPDSSISDQQYEHTRHVPGFPSPPPPYPISERSSYLFMTSSPAPPYQSPIVGENPTSSIGNTLTVPSTRRLDSSSMLTDRSIQTFQA